MQHFSELKVWQRSHALVLEIYGATKSYPGDGRLGLVSELQRAAVSVPANIAEASLAETEYLLLLSRDLDYISSEIYEPLQREASESARMLYALRTKIAPTD